MNKKILVLHTSVGLGHKYIAENIAYHLQQAGHDVLVHDILKVQEGVMTNLGIWAHSFVNRRLPFIWRWLYFSELVNMIGLPLRVPLAKANSDILLEIVKSFQPEVIISTQTTGSAATAALIQQQKFHGKFVIAFSDYHLHKFWLYDEADAYLVNTEEQKQQMIELGIKPEIISVCGITLKPQQVIDKVTLRDKLNVPLEDKLVIFGSGSLGIGFDFSLLASFLQQLTEHHNLTVLVLCGKNIQLKQNLDKKNIPNVVPLGFYDNPSELYQAGDLLITKPGGLTIAESLQAGIKILITHTLPGQEEPNYKYLVERSLVHPKPEPLTASTLVNTAIEMLSSGEESNQEESQLITQKGREGKILIAAVQNLFHNV